MRYALSFVALLCAVLVVQAQPGRNLATDQRVLTGAECRLVSLGAAGAEADLVAGTTVTLRFGEDGRASGSTGAPDESASSIDAPSRYSRSSAAASCAMAGVASANELAHPASRRAL